MTPKLSVRGLHKVFVKPMICERLDVVRDLEPRECSDQPLDGPWAFRIRSRFLRARPRPGLIRSASR
jgi:hypothetical protein